MDPRIRSAVVADADSVHRIWREGSAVSLGAELPTSIDYADAFREKIEQQDDTFKLWVGENDAGEVIGWLSLTPFRSNPAVREVMAELSAYVRIDQARSGVVKRLLQNAWDHCERTPLQYVNAFISSNNEPALLAALSTGFLIVGTLPASPKSSAPPLVYLSKVIRAPT
jgi:L-amino acid N-acyltransferase YncA